MTKFWIFVDVFSFGICQPSLLQIHVFEKTIKTDSFFTVFRKCLVVKANSYSPKYIWLEKYKLLIFLNVLTWRKLLDQMIRFKLILSSLSVNNFLLSSSCLYDVTNILLDTMNKCSKCPVNRKYFTKRIKSYIFCVNQVRWFQIFKKFWNKFSPNHSFKDNKVFLQRCKTSVFKKICQ